MLPYHVPLYTYLYGIISLISLVITIIAFGKGNNRIVFSLALLMAPSSWRILCGAFESAALSLVPVITFVLSV